MGCNYGVQTHAGMKEGRKKNETWQGKLKRVARARKEGVVYIGNGLAVCAPTSCLGKENGFITHPHYIQDALCSQKMIVSFHASPQA